LGQNPFTATGEQATKFEVKVRERETAIDIKLFYPRS
jgi:hypothetical protein